jgi:hypothetical protein
MRMNVRRTDRYGSCARSQSDCGHTITYARGFGRRPEYATAGNSRAVDSHSSWLPRCTSRPSGGPPSANSKQYPHTHVSGVESVIVESVIVESVIVESVIVESVIVESVIVWFKVVFILCCRAAGFLKPKVTMHAFIAKASFVGDIVPISLPTS